MIHSPHDLADAIEEHDFAERARRGDPLSLDRAWANRRMGGVGIRRGLRGPGRGPSRLIYSAQDGYSIDENPTLDYATVIATKVTSLVDAAEPLDDYAQAVDANRPVHVPSHASLGGKPALRYNGTTQRLTEAAVTARASVLWTFYVVALWNDVASPHFLLDTATGRMILLVGYSNRCGIFDTSARLAAGMIATGPQIATVQAQAGANASEAWTGSPGVSLGTFTCTPAAFGGATTLGANFPGTSGNIDGDVARVLGYAAIHDQATREAIQRQLSADYGGL